jgi:hypothetical protein
MNHDLTRLQQYLRRVGISGLSDVSFGGQLVDNVWHRTDCNVVGLCTNPMGPFPWSFLADKMTSSCCSKNPFLLAEEIVPSGVTAAVRAAEQLQLAEDTVAMWREDRSSTVFADCTAVDAAVEFQSELDELCGAVVMRYTRLNATFAAHLEAGFRRFDDDVQQLQRELYREPLFLDELFTTVHEKLGVERDDTPVLVSCSSFDVQHPDDSNMSYLLHALTITFALPAVTRRCLAVMPRWGYRALRQLGGRAWLSNAYANLDPAVEETARTLWVAEPDSPMFDFDSCIAAAQALCAEPALVN